MAFEMVGVSYCARSFRSIAIIAMDCLSYRSWGESPTRPEVSPQKSGDSTDMQAMDISAIALQGLNQAQAQLEQAGGRLASIGANTAHGVSVDTADLSQAAVSL